MKKLTDHVTLCMDLLKKICAHKSSNGQFYMVDSLTQVRRKHERKMNNTGKLDTSLTFGGSFNQGEPEDSIALMNNLEKKIKELDKLITEKVGFAFVKRG